LFVIFYSLKPNFSYIFYGRSYRKKGIERAWAAYAAMHFVLSFWFGLSALFRNY